MCLIEVMHSYFTELQPRPSLADIFFNLFIPPELTGLSLVSPDILRVRETQAQALTNVALLPSVVSYYLDNYSLRICFI